MIISIPVNYICNLSCKYCYFEINENNTISNFILKKILRNLIKDINISKRLDFFLDMKEPLLTPVLIKLIILEIEKQNFINYGITIFTNGTVQIEEDLLSFLLKRKKSIGFHLSLDGVHSFERGINKKQFIQIIKNINLVKKFFSYNIGYVIDDYTSNLTFIDFNKVYLFFIKLKIYNVNFYRKRVIGVKTDLDKYSVYLDNFIKIKTFILHINNSRKKEGLQIINDEHLDIFSNNFGCGALEGEIIGYDLKGNKNLCSEAIGQGEKHFDLTILKVKKYKEKKCKNCELMKICNSPCILEGEYKCLFYKKVYAKFG